MCVQGTAVLQRYMARSGGDTDELQLWPRGIVGTVALTTWERREEEPKRRNSTVNKFILMIITYLSFFPHKHFQEIQSQEEKLCLVQQQ